MGIDPNRRRTAPNAWDHLRRYIGRRRAALVVVFAAPAAPVRPAGSGAEERRQERDRLPHTQLCRLGIERRCDQSHSWFLIRIEERRNRLSGFYRYKIGTRRV